MIQAVYTESWSCHQHVAPEIKICEIVQCFSAVRSYMFDEHVPIVGFSNSKSTQFGFCWISPFFEAWTFFRQPELLFAQLSFLSKFEQKKKNLFREKPNILRDNQIAFIKRRKSVCVVSQFWLARIPKTSITIWQLKDWNGPRLRRLCLLHAVESQLFKKENVF